MASHILKYEPVRVNVPGVLCSDGCHVLDPTQTRHRGQMETTQGVC